MKKAKGAQLPLDPGAPGAQLPMDIDAARVAFLRDRIASGYSPHEAEVAWELDGKRAALKGDA